MDSLTADEWGTLIGAIAAIALAVLGWGVRRCARALEAWTGFRASEAQLQTATEICRQAVAYAEEQARKRTLGLADTGPIGSRQKLETAKKAARSLAPAAMIKVDDRQLETMLEAALQNDRARLSLAPGPSEYAPATPVPPAYRVKP